MEPHVDAKLALSVRPKLTKSSVFFSRLLKQLAAALHKQSVPPEGLNGNVVRAFDAICRNTGVNESHWKEISDAAKEMRVCHTPSEA